MSELSKIEATKLARLAAINASGADQASKDAAKLAAIAAADEAEANAFAKYNDALTKQGGLNDLDFYSKKTQITTLEVMRLASIEKTQEAQTVADKIALASGLNTIEEITAARKLAQEADDKAMAEAAAAKKTAEDTATSAYFAALTTKTTAALTADADLTKVRLDSIASVAAAEAAANAAAIAGVAALSAAIRSIPPYPTYTPPPLKPDFGNALERLKEKEIESLLPNLDGSIGGGGGAYDRNTNITINAGAIASQDEFTALLQDTIQRINRNGDPLFTAGAE